MNFKTKKVKAKTLGEYLRQCREYSGIALPEISKFSQVQKKFILALEEGRYQDLPDSVYVKGFLKSLSLIYHIPLATLLNQYLGEQEIAKNIEKSESDAETSFSTPKFIFSPKTLLIGSLAILGILSVSYLYFQVSSLKRPPSLHIISPAEDTTVNTGAVEVLGTTESGSTVYLNNQAIVVDAKGEFRENLTLAPGSNFLTIKSVNRFGKSSEVTKSIVYQEKEIAGAATRTPAILSDALIFEITMGEQASWIEIVADGVDKFSGTMLPNAHQTIIAREKIVLTTGNAGTTRVKFNGKDLGILGKEGEVIKDIEFTPTP